MPSPVPASPQAPARISRPPGSALLAGHHLDGMSITPPVRVQASLTVGSPDDPLEREADAVADAVMSSGTPDVQRMCDGCEEEEQVQRLEMPEEEEEIEQLQASPLAGGLVVAGNAASQVQAARSGGAPLSSSQRAFFEPRMSHDLSAVQVHAGPRAAAAAASVGARAFTVGRDIVLGAGQPEPDTFAGRRLLAHELTHVVQQGHAPRLARPGEE